MIRATVDWNCRGKFFVNVHNRKKWLQNSYLKVKVKMIAKQVLESESENDCETVTWKWKWKWLWNSYLKVEVQMIAKQLLESESENDCETVIWKWKCKWLRNSYLVKIVVMGFHKTFREVFRHFHKYFHRAKIVQSTTYKTGGRFLAFLYSILLVFSRCRRTTLVTKIDIKFCC